MALNLLPARQQIVDASGRATPEFSRFFNALFERVGGARGLSNSDLEVLTAAFSMPANSIVEQQNDSVDPWATIAELRKELSELRSRVELLTDPAAELSTLRRTVMSQAVESAFSAIPTDWEHPGSIGAGTANSGSFTSLSASSTLAVSGAATFGKTGAAGAIQLRRASDGAIVGTDKMNGNVREIDNGAGSIVVMYGSSEKIRTNSTGVAVTGSLTATGNSTITGAFGCNGAGASAKVTVSGSRGGNAALASLISAMGNFGFINDSTTA